jgi:hypothetical protein
VKSLQELLQPVFIHNGIQKRFHSCAKGKIFTKKMSASASIVCGFAIKYKTENEETRIFIKN